MLEESAAPAFIHEEHSSNAGKWVMVLLAVVFVAGTLYAVYDSRARLEKLEKANLTSATQVTELSKRVSEAEASSETLAHQLGMTKKELAQRTAQLLAEQRASERMVHQHTEQITQVSGEVAGVKSEMGGVKTDVASTRSDLEATKARLETVKGDMGVMSGLVATTRKELEVIKHRGDRNYYEFTLDRGKRPTPVSTVSLQLKNTDAKRGKFTLNVMADDRTIEKKDRNVNEPIQFYNGRGRMLYALVVCSVVKDKIRGCLRTAKLAPRQV